MLIFEFYRKISNIPGGILPSNIKQIFEIKEI